MPALAALSLRLSSGQRFMGDVLDMAAAQKNPPVPFSPLPSPDPTAAASGLAVAPAHLLHLPKTASDEDLHGQISVLKLH